MYVYIDIHTHTPTLIHIYFKLPARQQPTPERYARQKSAPELLVYIYAHTYVRMSK